MPRWLKIFFVLIGAVFAVVATSPWWLGWLLGPIARSYGATFSHYETIGYSRFSLSNVRLDRPGLTVTAARLEAPSPVCWLWRKANRVVVDDWRVVVQPDPSRDKPKQSRTISGLPALHQQIQHIGGLVAQWVPSASLKRGEITWPADSLKLENAELRQGKLTINGLRWRETLTDLTANGLDSGETRLSVAESANDFRSTIVWRGADVSATGSLWNQPFSAQARFPANSWWPDEATVQAENWKLPAERLKLGGSYSTGSGSARLRWWDKQFELIANGGTEAKPGSAAPPLTVQIEASGDAEKIAITKANINAPFATATLSAPLNWSFDRKLPAGPARLNVEADLEKQPWTQRIAGKVRGVAEVNAESRIGFELELNSARFDRHTVQHAIIAGALTWPRLEITRAKLDLDDASHADIAGQIDFSARTFENVALRADLAGTWFAALLPRELEWKRAELTAQVAGPWSAPQYDGTLNATETRYGRLKPVSLRANWRGTGAHLDEVRLKAATASGASLEAAGGVTATTAEVRELRLATSASETWQLETPAKIGWSPALNIENLRLRSPDGQLAASLTGERGKPAANIAATNVRSKLIADWIDLSGPAWEVRNLTAVTRMEDGLLVFDSRLNGRVELEPTAADVSLVIRGDRTGVKLDEAKFVEGDRTVATATGNIAATWKPEAAESLTIDRAAPLEFQAQIEPQASIWTSLPALVGVTLAQPAADIRLTGTLNQPRGELRATAKRLAVARDRFGTALPEIDDLSLQAHAVRDALIVDSLSVKIDGQPARADGRISIAGDKWRQLLDAPLPYLWQSAEGQLVLENFELASLARRFPTILAAQGRLTARLNLTSGSHLNGELRLQEAATRPLGPFGVFQDINAEMVLNDRTLDIRSWTAVLGGQPATLAGKITLPPSGQPQLAVTLKGENLPLVRRSGLLMRSDLDVHVDTNANGTTQVSGAVNLRDCIVLADLAALIPSGPRTVAQQPPYFSVDIPPFNQWRLAVDIRGRKAIRVNTAVFKGIATPKFHLSGTLGEPRAVGDVTVDEGRVLFPFATFNVLFASVRLSDADPYHPQLTLNAQARYHDYQLRLEGSGPVEQPTVTFSSVPALETAQVLMMVTSGQVPETDPGARSGSQRLTQLGTYLGQGLLQGTSSDASRLEIAAGERVSRQGKETYEFTYRLDDRWSLVGEYDEYDEYNAGVKWRAYTKEGDGPKRK